MVLRASSLLTLGRAAAARAARRCGDVGARHRLLTPAARAFSVAASGHGSTVHKDEEAVDPKAILRPELPATLHSQLPLDKELPGCVLPHC